MAAAPQQEQRQFRQGLVKSVLSGDSIILQGRPTKAGPPPEQTLSLAQINAPRLGRRPIKEEVAQKDEPFAWEAREYLRKRLVGHVVHYCVDYKVPSGREYGQIILDRGTAREENIIHSLLREGLAKIRDNAKGGGEEFEQLKSLQAGAQDAKAGIWAPDASSHVRDVKWTCDNPRSLVDSFHQKPIQAIIEQVRDGCTVRAFLLPDFHYVTVMMSGIKSPVFKRNPDGTENPEPLAPQAKFYTESRLLQREVLIVLEGVNNNNFLGTVIHPKAGNISEYLLSDGLARIVDWSFGVVSQGRDKYRAAQGQAQAARKGVWHNYVPKTVNLPAGAQDFEAVVEEIVNGESIVVRTPSGSQRVFLSSIRQPRAPAAEGDEKRRRRPWEIPYMLEAREFMRSKLIGKKVDVHIDYVQPASENYPEKTCATVTVNGINIANALVSKGYATVLRHRADDENRSSAYDDLLAAESRAIKNKKGLHSNKEAPVHRIAEVSNKAQADPFVRSLQRAGRTHAVVEFVAAGSRVRVYIPKETCMIGFNLSGISCPRTGRGSEPSQPFADEALAFTRSFCLQHDVEIEVFDSDRGGNLVGNVFCDNKNLSIELLRAGFAKLHGSAERLSNYTRMCEAETEAKDARRGVWTNYDPAAEQAAAAAQQEEEPAEETQERTQNLKQGVVTEATHGTTVYIQQPNSAALNQINAVMAQESFKGGSVQPKRGMLCAAEYSLDRAWYRAKIVEITSDGIQVHFIDYGNSETVTSDRIAPVPREIADLPAQAHRYRLAFFADVPADWVNEAESVLREAVLDRAVMYNAEYKRDDEYVTLYNQNQEDIGLDLIKTGYGIVADQRSPRFQKILAEYKKAQTHALKSHLGIWVYGDVRGDDM